MQPLPEWSGKWDATADLPPVPKQGFVKFRRITAVDRTDKPGGAKGGPPGQPAATYLTYSEEGDRAVSFSEIVQEGSQYVLYSIEQGAAPQLQDLPGQDRPGQGPPKPGEVMLVFLQLHPRLRRALYE